VDRVGLWSEIKQLLELLDKHLWELLEKNRVGEIIIIIIIIIIIYDYILILI